MNHPDEPGNLFQTPAGPHVAEYRQPAVDDSDEARRRLRRPFDVQQPGTPDLDPPPARNPVCRPGTDD